MTCTKAELNGLNVLITRPAHQAKFLCDAITHQGANAILFPTLEIRAIADRAPLLAVIQQLTEYHLAIFISANAVLHAFSPGGLQAHPPQLQIAAIGPATAEMLSHHHWTTHTISPPPFNTEALLKLLELTPVYQQRIIIFCGENGNTLLADTLRTRGADVTAVSVYRRIRPAPPTALQLQQWRQHLIHTIVSTSCESLQNLHDLFSPADQAWLKQIPLTVISQRMADLAHKLGFIKPPVIATNASDAGLLDAVKLLFLSPAT